MKKRFSLLFMHAGNGRFFLLQGTSGVTIRMGGLGWMDWSNVDYVWVWVPWSIQSGMVELHVCCFCSSAEASEKIIPIPSSW
jgi:hypothetical protein